MKKKGDIPAEGALKWDTFRERKRKASVTFQFKMGRAGMEYMMEVH